MTAIADSLARWAGVESRPLCFAGPRVVESEAQLAEVARRLRGVPVDFLAVAAPPRAVDGEVARIESACGWLQSAARAHGLRSAFEVTTGRQAEAALATGIDLLWISGATSQSPAALYEITAALHGAPTPLLVANPDAGEIVRWLAAIERLRHSVAGELAALFVGGGATAGGDAVPQTGWRPLIELRRSLPELPVVVHASAFAGAREGVLDAAQDALDLGAEGVWIEVHPDPDHAWRWPERHLTPERLGAVLGALTARRASSDDARFAAALAALRGEIDAVDRRLLELLAARGRAVERIAALKRTANVAPLQVERWRTMLADRLAWAAAHGLDSESVRALFVALHAEALRRQGDLLRRPTDGEPSRGPAGE